MAYKAPLLIAHRGMPRRAQENTLASFGLALEAGADGIELDVHRTRDGVIVVHHDPTLEDGQKLTSSSYAEIGAANPAFPIPTLADVLRLAVDRAEVFVEIKGSSIEADVLASLNGYRGAFAVHSFDHAAITRISQSGAEVRLGILLEKRVTDIASLMRKTGALDVWPHHPLVSNELVARVHEAGGRVIPWTVNTASDARRVRELGVDGICGDDVTVIRSALTE